MVIHGLWPIIHSCLQFTMPMEFISPGALTNFENPEIVFVLQNKNKTKKIPTDFIGIVQILKVIATNNR